MYKVGLVGISLLIIMACGSSKALIGDDFAVSMKKGSCFGSCPVYSLAIDKKGNMIYDGERFTDKIGKHSLKLSKEELKDLAADFNDANLSQFSDTYKSNITDLPTVTISHTNNGKSKTVSGKSNLPDKVLELQNLMETVAAKEGWVSLEPAKVKKAKEEEKEKEDTEIVDNEIIVQFKKGTFISRWLKGYKDYKLNVSKPLTDDRMTWLLRFDKRSIDPRDLLYKVKQDPGIESAEFNRKLTAR